MLLFKLEKENVSFFKQLDRKSEECKYDKLSYERALKNMTEQNNLLRTQLESHKGKGEETKFAKPSTSEKPNVSNTVTKPKMSISRFAPKVDVQKDFTKVCLLSLQSPFSTHPFLFQDWYKLFFI